MGSQREIEEEVRRLRIATAAARRWLLSHPTRRQRHMDEVLKYTFAEHGDEAEVELPSMEALMPAGQGQTLSPLCRHLSLQLHCQCKALGIIL